MSSGIPACVPNAHAYVLLVKWNVVVENDFICP